MLKMANMLWFKATTVKQTGYFCSIPENEFCSVFVWCLYRKKCTKACILCFFSIESRALEI